MGNNTVVKIVQRASVVSLLLFSGCTESSPREGFISVEVECTTLRKKGHERSFANEGDICELRAQKGRICYLDYDLLDSQHKRSYLDCRTYDLLMKNKKQPGG